MNLVNPEKIKPGYVFQMTVLVQAHPGGWVTAYPELMDGYVLIQKLPLMVRVPIDFNLYATSIEALEKQKLQVLEDAQTKVRLIEDQIQLINKNHDN